MTTDEAVIQKGYDYLRGFEALAATTFVIVLNVIFYMYCSRKTKNNY